MIDTKVLCALGVAVGAGVLLLAGGMDATGAFVGLDRHERATLRVVAGAPIGPRGAAMEFRLYACGQGAPLRARRVPTRAGVLGGFDGFAGLPVDTGRAHRFAEAGWRVQQGCYRVETRVVDANGAPVGICEAARTPDIYLDAELDEQFAVLADCATPGDDAVEVDGRLNHAPTLGDLSARRLREPGSCETVEVCATARDRDGDPMTMQWSATARRGQPLELPRPVRHARPGRLTECVALSPGAGQWRFDVTVRDQTNDPDSHALLTWEDVYVGDWGLVAHSHDTRSIVAGADCEQHRCPADPAERVSQISYWITRDGELLAPTSDLSEVREGDTVDVEFEVADGCEDTRVTFASYTAGAKDGDDRATKRAETASVFSRVYGPGSHMLWNVLPDCRFTADLYLGEPLERAQRAGEQPYGKRLLDSYSGGTHACERP